MTEAFRVLEFDSRTMRRFQCPFCMRLVVADDARRSLHHEQPECASFRATLAAFGETVESDGITVIVDAKPPGAP
jgi:hypothetical protein